MPILEVKARRVGGSNYQKYQLKYVQNVVTLAIRWLIATLALRGEKDYVAREIMDAASTTLVHQLNANMHKMAEANKAHSLVPLVRFSVISLAVIS